MADASDVTLRDIAAVNDLDGDNDPWAADAQLVAPGGEASGRDEVLGFMGVFHEAFPDLRPEIKQLLSGHPRRRAPHPQRRFARHGRSASPSQPWLGLGCCRFPCKAGARRPVASLGLRVVAATGALDAGHRGGRVVRSG